MVLDSTVMYQRREEVYSGESMTGGRGECKNSMCSGRGESLHLMHSRVYGQ